MLGFFFFPQVLKLTSSVLFKGRDSVMTSMQHISWTLEFIGMVGLCIVFHGTLQLVFMSSD